MSLATVGWYLPIARNEYLDRLAVHPPRLDTVGELWTEVHEEVQKQLASLESKVRSEVADVHVDVGRTKGERFLLFTYRAFSLSGTTIDPVVAGMTFTLADGNVAVEADVSGEQNGDMILSPLRSTVAHARGQLLELAHDFSQKLCQSADLIATALRDSSRGLE